MDGRKRVRTRRKISRALRGREISWRDKISAGLNGRSDEEKDEWKRKISASLTGRKVSEETRARMSKAQRRRKRLPL